MATSTQTAPGSPAAPRAGSAPSEVGPFRTISLIARNELADSIRARRVIVMLLLYALGAVGATLMFIKGVQVIETELAKTAGLASSGETGAVTSALWKSPAFRRMVGRLVGDPSLVDTLFAVPPLALFYGWLSGAFTPLLILLTSSGRIAEEVASGSVRFVMFRTERSYWCIGKFLGQAVQVFVALLLSAAAAWIIGWIRLKTFEPGPTALYMFWFALKAWLYAMPFLGLALGISQCFTSANLAITCGLIAAGALALLNGLSKWLAGDGWHRIWNVIRVLTPGGHRQDLWWNDAGHLIPASAWLLGLCLAFLLLGYFRFSRRDL